ncbi:hypothetical protein P691DRAFT_782095 [Macrolepiota fuliginosa MF-IS2]|uniref:DNA-directed RNA polymerase III subunit RPC9 n=1 Tax=Macrolepiota fuliginosa MF-IS2 TaxID=1400762 RepID=A0A9P5XQ28_9AGAR|nr:hypothetical protein P691DRAFT_782095 [Macrolepiota fuliginosa MF-IS2]
MPLGGMCAPSKNGKNRPWLVVEVADKEDLCMVTEVRDDKCIPGTMGSLPYAERCTSLSAQSRLSPRAHLRIEESGSRQGYLQRCMGSILERKSYHHSQSLIRKQTVSDRGTCYKILTLLKELENDHLARSKAAMRIKRSPLGNTHTHGVLSGISENLRTTHIEAIQYLSSGVLPTALKTPTGVSNLITAFSPYDLTKSEKMQIVNLAPARPVELYIIIEELEDCLGDSMDTILDTIKSSLSTRPPPHINGKSTTFTSTATSLLGASSSSGGRREIWDEVDAGAIIDDVEFVDHAGEPKGGLDVDDG